VSAIDTERKLREHARGCARCKAHDAPDGVTSIDGLPQCEIYRKLHRAYLDKLRGVIRSP
jgi:hypothetical protein